MFATIWVYGGEGRGLNWRILGQHAGEVGKHGGGLAGSSFNYRSDKDDM